MGSSIDRARTVSNGDPQKKGQNASRFHPFLIAWPTLISSFTVIHRAKCLIINELGDCGIVSTDRAIGITTYLKGVEACAQGIVHQQFAYEGSTLTENHFNCLCGLDQANCAGQNAQNTCFVSGRRQVCRWGHGVEATITRPLLVARIHRNLALKSEDTAVYNGFV